MTPIYTVFALMDDDKSVRYVGVTTQALSKRLHDMRSASNKDAYAMYSTPVGTWIRELGKAPAFEVVYEGTDKELANEEYCVVINKNIEGGKLLNSTTGKRAGLRTEFIYERGPSGKTVYPFSDHAQASVRRKLYLVKKNKDEQSES